MQNQAKLAAGAHQGHMAKHPLPCAQDELCTDMRHAHLIWRAAAISKGGQFRDQIAVTRF